MTLSPQLFFVRVSQLAHYRFCAKRCKIECTRQVSSTEVVSGYVSAGNKFHFDYSCPYKSFDRQLVRYQLEQKYGKVLQKQVDNIVVRGTFDDLRVLWNWNAKSKTVSLVEVKTTHKPSLWYPELQAAEFQLQLYAWILKDRLHELGWTLHQRHYVEVYSQRNGKLMRRMVVHEDPDIEEKIRYIYRGWQGLERMSVPRRYVCKACPHVIKAACDWKDRI